MSVAKVPPTPTQGLGFRYSEPTQMLGGCGSHLHVQCLEGGGGILRDPALKNEVERSHRGKLSESISGLHRHVHSSLYTCSSPHTNMRTHMHAYHTNIQRGTQPQTGPGEMMAQLIKYFPCKHECLSSVLRTHLKKQNNNTTPNNNNSNNKKRKRKNAEPGGECL